jgi:stage V sporulation protein S
MDVLKVSSKSSPSSVAGAMAGVVRQRGAVEVQVVGAGALNQAVKAVAIARGYLAPSGIDVVCIPTFVDVLIDGESRTALRLLIEDRAGAHGQTVSLTVDLRSDGATPGPAEQVAPAAPVEKVAPAGHVEGARA